MPGSLVCLLCSRHFYHSPTLPLSGNITAHAPCMQQKAALAELRCRSFAACLGTWNFQASPQLSIEFCVVLSLATSYAVLRLFQPSLPSSAQRCSPSFMFPGALGVPHPLVDLRLVLPGFGGAPWVRRGGESRGHPRGRECKWPF